MNPKIILTTLNAKYHHSSFGLRYLFANLKELRESTQLIEFTLSQNPRDIAEAILTYNAKIVGFGIYIWNTEQSLKIISILKKIKPQLLIVLGGPEVSYESENQSICQAADFIIQGEADFLFYEFCRNFLTDSKLPSKKWISGILPNVKEIASPYSYYTENDIRHRVIYVEASRGCPYKCEYCLSSLDKSVRNFDLDSFMTDMNELIQRGAKQFKFVDRTFNLSISTSTQILKFFLDRISIGLFLHFEMVPDRLPLEIRELIQKFPPGSLQFEIGIQTWNPEVSQRVSRKQDLVKIQENFKFLTQETGVHIHADLIAGLPGESLESFANGFDAISLLNPHEIQLGILKRLKGTPIIRHNEEWAMIYQDDPPFQILQTKTMNFETIQKIGRFAQFWNLYANSGNFKNTLNLIKAAPNALGNSSWFWKFFRFSEYLSNRHPQGNGISLIHLVESAWIFLIDHLNISDEFARSALIQDYTGKIKRDIPSFLRPAQKKTRKTYKSTTNQEKNPLLHTPQRQMRHLITNSS